MNIGFATRPVEGRLALIATSGATDADAPVRATSTATTTASPERLWSVLADLASWPRFIPGLTAMAPPAALEAGRRFTWTNQGTRLHSTLRVAEPGRELTWTGCALWLVALHRNTVDALPGGGARLTSEETMHGLGVSLLLPATKLESGLREFVAAVAHEAERRTSED